MPHRCRKRVVQPYSPGCGTAHPRSSTRFLGSTTIKPAQHRFIRFCTADPCANTQTHAQTMERVTCDTIGRIYVMNAMWPNSSCSHVSSSGSDVKLHLMDVSIGPTGADVYHRSCEPQAVNRSYVVALRAMHDAPSCALSTRAIQTDEEDSLNSRHNKRFIVLYGQQARALQAYYDMLKHEQAV